LYYSELARWNQKINLTALVLDAEGVDSAVDRLLVEPLIAARHIPPETRSLLDVGSGGGSPAIPIKLARPEIALTMVEVKVRKSAFLRQIARILQLQQTSVETTRFEELLSRPHFHEAFDCITIRAVRIDQAAWVGIQAFLRPGGTAYHFSSGRAAYDTPPLFTLVDTIAIPGDSVGRLMILRKEFVGRRFT
jgi:16S rRNA (guanine527-N7)-methyltransferase